MSFDDFITFDDNLSTNGTIEGDWEQTIMDKAKGVIDEYMMRAVMTMKSQKIIAESLVTGKHIFMVNELKIYALSRNETGLTQALTEAEELIEHSVLKKQLQAKTINSPRCCIILLFIILPSRLRQSTLSTYFSVA